MVLGIIIVVTMFLLIAIIIVMNKFIDKISEKFFKNIFWNYIIKNLTKQGITNLEEDINEEAIISRVRIYYKNHYNYENLNLILMKLENQKLDRIKFMMSNFHALLVGLLVGVVGCLSSLSKIDTNTIGCVGFILLVLIGSGTFKDLLSEGENSRLDIAINIHKSVIREQLKKIEEDKKQQEKEDVIKTDLKEIREHVLGAKRETETLRRIFETKANM